MKLPEVLGPNLEPEGRRTRRAVEQVPEGRDDWKPHAKSMPLGGLALLVAGMPAWLAMIVRDDQLDLNPPGGSSYRPAPLRTRAERIQALDDGIAKAREALAGTTDE